MLCRAGGRFALSTPFQSDVLSPKIPTKGGGIMERDHGYSHRRRWEKLNIQSSFLRRYDFPLSSSMKNGKAVIGQRRSGREFSAGAETQPKANTHNHQPGLIFTWKIQMPLWQSHMILMPEINYSYFSGDWFSLNTKLIIILKCKGIKPKMPEVREHVWNCKW